ncbi:cytochrome P450 [Luteococcus sp. Sow4_B9]|uniref:cytochrome P450 n=1 Tax=Luteococcus sp. Sow4_B9 TaxID=3438792 RepID=UPI003F9C76B1
MSATKDRTIDFVSQGYLWTTRLRAGSGDGQAATRLPVKVLGSRALLVNGEEGVRLFYDQDKVQRTDAMPSVVGGGLFGKGSVHGLDGEQHRVRKAMFVRAAMDRPRVDNLLADARLEWEKIIELWTQGEELSVYDAAVLVYGRSIIRWAGLDVDDQTRDWIATTQAEIVDGFAVPGPAWLKTRKDRTTMDEWFTEQVRKARAGEITVADDSPFQMVLDHVEADGSKLDDHLAGVELQNLIRPTIAVCRFAAFAAVALAEHPDWLDRIRAEVTERGTTIEGPVATSFAEEVRRHFPFVPMLPAIAKKDFEFQGEQVKKGQRILLDFYGTNHDERSWDRPNSFDPQRFLDDPSHRESDHFIPQGGGTAQTGHRCPGEWVAVGQLALTVAELAQLDMQLPADVDWSMTRMPTAPKDGVVPVSVQR